MTDMTDTDGADRCYVCRRPRKDLRIWFGNARIQACASCFSAVRRVRELEQREEALSALAGDYESVNVDASESHFLGEVVRFFDRALETLPQEAGKGHALVRVEDAWACHLPGCELCDLAAMARDLRNRL